uniref:BMA-RGS-3 n=1 Tax=Brugia malayi TaxID=6279 RepID=A0A0J9XWQ8_BRUMA|nr:BMA-RGS-3 [Brugia malayi]
MQAESIFDFNSKVSRRAPELPSTDGIEYPRAAAWASESLNNVLKDEKGRQLFRVFLHDSLAEENLSFIESYDKFKQMTSPADKKQYIQEFFEKYSPYVNLSSVALVRIYKYQYLDFLRLAFNKVFQVLWADLFFIHLIL